MSTLTPAGKSTGWSLGGWGVGAGVGSECVHCQRLPHSNTKKNDNQLCQVYKEDLKVWGYVSELEFLTSLQMALSYIDR